MKKPLLYLLIAVLISITALSRCGESESDRLERETNAQINENIEQFKKDSLRDCKIKKAMDDHGLNYKQASEQVDTIYKF